MMGRGPQELLLLACFGLPMFLGTIVVLLAAIRYLSKSPQQRMTTASVAPSLSHQDVLRTRYFRAVPAGSPRTCPRCRTALAADAPEGLCPACLLAGGLPSESLPPTSSGHGSAKGVPTIDTAALSEAFPHLEVIELLGQGGMGTVFKVRQKNLDRLAALKVIPPQAALDPTFSERFAREARALARLNHSSIVTVYDYGQLGGFYFLLMEYVDGPNLRQLMRNERIAPREALAIVPQICDALQYAHDQGVVHRDVKPENVLLDRTGRVKIADFGLAKLLGASPADFTLTHTQQVMGTPRYMAPEQIERPSTVDHRADIYSLGVVLYEMLTGELPIGRFAPPSQKVEVDVRLDEIVLRSLEKGTSAEVPAGQPGEDGN
jgi:predicted Ser/Thr protein kinase